MWPFVVPAPLITTASLGRPGFPLWTETLARRLSCSKVLRLLVPRPGERAWGEGASGLCHPGYARAALHGNDAEGGAVVLGEKVFHSTVQGRQLPAALHGGHQQDGVRDLAIPL